MKADGSIGREAWDGEDAVGRGMHGFRSSCSRREGAMPCPTPHGACRLSVRAGGNPTPSVPEWPSAALPSLRDWSI